MPCCIHQVGGIVHRPSKSEHMVCMYVPFLECGEEFSARQGQRQSSGCTRFLIIAVRGEANRYLKLRPERTSGELLDNHPIVADTTRNQLTSISAIRGPVWCPTVAKHINYRGLY